MAQLDMKNREFYDELTDEERKKFSTYLMMKYSANVEGSSDLQAWYLMASNERVNINFFDFNNFLFLFFSYGHQMPKETMNKASQTTIIKT